jgi:hypothetical protein
LKEEILDLPMIHKLACNIRDLLKVDHVALSMREQLEGDDPKAAVFVVAESDLPKAKKPEPGAPAILKRHRSGHRLHWSGRRRRSSPRCWRPAKA